MAIVSYQMKGTLFDAPEWWQRFVRELDDEYPDIDDISDILREKLKDEYCATLSRSEILRRGSQSFYILRFDNEACHLMFMMRYT